MTQTQDPAQREQVYHSDHRPDFTPFVKSAGTIRGFTYAGNLTSELAAGTITQPEALDLLEDMLTIREFEEMIVKLRSGAYDRLPGLQLPRPHPRLDRPGGVGRRRCCGIALRRLHHLHPPRPRRQHRQGLRRHPRHERRRPTRARPGTAGRTKRDGAARGGPRGPRLPHHRRAVRQGGRLLQGPRRRHAHRRLHRRPPRRQRHRRRRRADRHRRGHGRALPAATARSSAASPATAPTPTASCSSR